MISQLELYLMGAIAGFTIFLGLPIAMGDYSRRLKAFLNSVATGILIFILIEVLHKVVETGEDIVMDSLKSSFTLHSWETLLAIVFGISFGLLSLVWFEERYIRTNAKKYGEHKAMHIATMIAIGIGLHNFSEGLAIGQSYVSGSISLALLLVIGFGLHNATEGFGIAAPLAGTKPNWRQLLKLGLIGGGPTFIGSIIGGIYLSVFVSTLFLALASGAIIYVIKELLHHGRIENEGMMLMAGLLLGLFLGYATELVVKIAGG